MSGDTQGGASTIGRSPAREQTAHACVRGITLPTACRGRREHEKTGRGKSKQAPVAQPRLLATLGTHHTPHINSRSSSSTSTKSRNTPSTSGTSTTFPCASRTRRRTFERECGLSPFARARPPAIEARIMRAIDKAGRDPRWLNYDAACNWLARHPEANSATAIALYDYQRPRVVVTQSWVTNGISDIDVETVCWRQWQDRVWRVTFFENAGDSEPPHYRGGRARQRQTALRDRSRTPDR